MNRRGSDPTGYGHYGAKRGTRKHKGIDLLTKPGMTVFSPIDGFITKLGTAYKATTRFKYIDVSGEEYRWRLMYCRPTLKLGARITAGDFIGTAQDIAAYHGGEMLCHIHVECYKHGLLTDPEPLLFNLFEDEKNDTITDDIFNPDHILPHN